MRKEENHLPTAEESQTSNTELYEEMLKNPIEFGLNILNQHDEGAEMLLTKARNEITNSYHFCKIIEILTTMLCSQACLSLDRCKPVITTGNRCKYTGLSLTNKIDIVSIFRASMIMQGPARDFFYLLTGSMPRLHAMVMQRDKENPERQTVYLNKCDAPFNWNDVPIIVDPMLATGGSISSTIQRLIELGYLPDFIKILAIIAAPEGVKKIHDQYPEVEIFCVALDEQLNEECYIMPGLGDAGEREFGVK
jgi:uracil phosphoribosyltransferase